MWIGQGLSNKVLFFNNKIAYLINPKINLSFQLEYSYRHQANALNTQSTHFFNIGFVSGFRNLYKDR